MPQPHPCAVLSSLAPVTSAPASKRVTHFQENSLWLSCKLTPLLGPKVSPGQGLQSIWAPHPPLAPFPATWGGQAEAEGRGGRHSPGQHHSGQERGHVVVRHPPAFDSRREQGKGKLRQGEKGRQLPAPQTVRGDAALLPVLHRSHSSMTLETHRSTRDSSGSQLPENTALPSPQTKSHLPVFSSNLLPQDLLWA